MTADPIDIDEQTPPYDDEEAAYSAAVKFNEEVAAKARDLQIYDEARRRLRRAELEGLDRPQALSLAELLARPATEPTYRIDDVWPTGGRVVLAAQFKAGKSTTVGNVIRSLVDGSPLFDRFPVRPGARVFLIDDELDDRTLQRWLADQQIQNTADVAVVCLRGALSTFDITDPDLRAEWARDLTGADVIILDCLRPILDALNLDENHDAGRFLVAFDALLKEAGASEALVVHHMGHGAERSRGDSRINDWPDALWKLVRDKDEDDPTTDDLTGARYFSAFGRDVNVPQAELTYDPTTRRQTLSAEAANRRVATQQRRYLRTEEAVLAVVTANRGINKTKLRETMRADHGIGRNEDIDSAVERLVAREQIHRVKAGNTHQHYLAEQPNLADTDTHLPNLPNVPNQPTGTRADMCPPASIGGHLSTTPPDTPHAPNLMPDLNVPIPTCPDCEHPIDSTSHTRLCEEPR